MKKKLTSENIITLPKELRDDIKAVGLDKTKQSHAFKFVHLLLRDSYHSHENYISYSSKSQNFIIKVFDKNYNQWLRPLKDAEIIICDNRYSNANNKSFYFAINPKYFTGEANFDSLPIIESEVYKDVIKHIDYDYESIKEYVEGDLSELTIDIAKLEAITLQIVRDISIKDFRVNEQINRELFELFVQHGKGLYSYFTSKAKAIEKAKELGKIIVKSNQKIYMVDEVEFINVKKKSMATYYMDSINRMKAKMYRFGINGTNNRLDHNLTNMPTVLVDEICKDNNLMQLDLSNSQFAILCLILKNELDTDDFKAFKELACSGQLYESMQEKLGLKSRDEAKVTMFELLFSSHNNKSEGKAKLKEFYPSVIDWIDNYKAQNGYEAFSVMLQLKESEIFIQKLWNTIKEKGFFCISRHDSLIYKTEDQNQIEGMVTEYFNEIGLDCHLKLSDNRRIKISGVVESNDELLDEDLDNVKIETKRMTTEEYFKRFRNSFGSFITESSLDDHYNVLSKHFKYIDEIPQEHKTKCIVETYIDGVFGKQNLF